MPIGKVTKGPGTKLQMKRITKGHIEWNAKMQVEINK